MGDTMKNKIASTAFIAPSSVIINSTVGSYCSIDINTRFCYSKIDCFSYISVNSNIFSTEIGKFSSISWNVSINPANHDYTRFTQHPILFAKKYGMLRDDPFYHQYGKVSLGNDVWIGSNVVIMGDVKIGDGAIIGANTRISKDVPPYAIMIGNNNHYKNRFNDEVIEALMKLQWWNAPIELIKENITVLSQHPTVELCKLLANKFSNY